jgi:uncharacterized membrane protein
MQRISPRAFPNILSPALQLRILLQMSKLQTFNKKYLVGFSLGGNK